MQKVTTKHLSDINDSIAYFNSTKTYTPKFIFLYFIELCFDSQNPSAQLQKPDIENDLQLLMRAHFEILGDKRNTLPKAKRANRAAGSAVGHGGRKAENTRVRKKLSWASPVQLHHTRSPGRSQNPDLGKEERSDQQMNKNHRSTHYSGIILCDTHAP